MAGAGETTDPGMTIAGTPLGSRVLIGSSGYPNRQIMLEAIAASGAAMVTAAIRRISLEGYAESVLDALSGWPILPNTAGCETARDAVLTAQLAREALGTSWIKLEVIGDRETLYPDTAQLVGAAEELVGQGFTVLPYTTEDPVVAQRLADAGCAAVMPLGSPIGSGQGIVNPWAIELICRRSPVPVILDAGIGTASDATRALELGCEGVLVNTAVAKARDPVAMARAMRDAVHAGAAARDAGRMPVQDTADPSSPQLGLIGS